MFLSSLRGWFNRSRTAGAAIPPEGPASADPQELFLTGLRFAKGEGVAQDFLQAAQCYTRAAEQGHSLAQLNLAELHERGEGVERNPAKALLWLTKAANLGNAAAQYRLGVHEHLAVRTEQAGAGGEHRIEALKWVRLSADHGNRGAENACQFVALAMTGEQVAESARRVAAFVPGPSIQALQANPALEKSKLS